MTKEIIKNEHKSLESLSEKIVHEKQDHLKRLEAALSHLAFALGREQKRQEEIRRALEEQYQEEIEAMAKRMSDLETNVRSLIEKLTEKEQG